MGPERNDNGTYGKGVSGNPRGRPKKKPDRHRFPFENRKVVFEVAETQFSVNTPEGSLQLSAYRANLLAMAKRGASGHTPSAKLFFQEVEKAAAVHGEQTEFTRWLLQEQEGMQEQLDRYEARFPPINCGVVILQPDGTVIPSGSAEQPNLPASSEK